MPESLSAVADQIQQFLASETQPAAVDSWVERIRTPILENDQTLATDAVLAEHLRRAVRSHWMAFLASLGEPVREVHLVQAGALLAKELARREHPVTTLFAIYRTAQQAVWEYLTSGVGTTIPEGSTDAEFIVYFWSRASSWINASIEQSVEIFQAERDRVQQGAAAQRLVAVRSLLTGATLDGREASAALGGHPLSGYNTALLLRSEEADRVADLSEAVGALARAVGTRNPLIVRPGGQDLWCWLSHRSTPDLEALKTTEDWLRARGISVAVGTPLTGPAGFRISHLEAQQAQKITFRRASSQSVTLFSEVELLSLLTANSEAAARFVRRRLGGLAEDGDGPARLRQTFHTLLVTGSVEAAARALSVHKNTVRYRVSQAEALLDRPHDYSPTELALAIGYYEAFLAPAPTD